MLRVYGVDVLDPATTLRRVRILRERLRPGDWAEQDHEMSWTWETYLLAQVVDEISALTYTVMRALGQKPKQPKPFYRPKSARRVPQPPARSERPSASTWGALAEALTANGGGKGVVVIEE